MASVCSLFQFLELADAFRARIDEVLEPFGLTKATFSLLYRLQSGPLTNKELACESACGPSNITRLVDRLAQQGFVSRSPAAHDRRQVVTRLEEAGRRAYADAAEALQATQTELLRSLSDFPRLEDNP